MRNELALGAVRADPCNMYMHKLARGIHTARKAHRRVVCCIAEKPPAALAALAEHLDRLSDLPVQKALPQFFRRVQQQRSAAFFFLLASAMDKAQVKGRTQRLLHLQE